PLLAKVIGSSGSLPTRPAAASAAASAYRAALDRTSRALEEFHVAGLPTNLGELRAILSHPAVRAGDARVTLLSEDPGILDHPPAADGAALDLLERSTPAGARAARPAAPSLEPRGEQ